MDKPKAEKPKLRTPLDAYRGWRSKLPENLASVLDFVLRWLSWPLLLVSFAGVISDIQTLAVWIADGLQRIADLSPILAAIVGGITVAFESWREFLAPIREWLGALLHISIPPPVLDLMLIMLLPLTRLATFRFIEWRSKRFKSKVIRPVDADVAEEFQRRMTAEIAAAEPVEVDPQELFEASTPEEQAEAVAWAQAMERTFLKIENLEGNARQAKRAVVIATILAALAALLWSIDLLARVGVLSALNVAPTL